MGKAKKRSQAPVALVYFTTLLVFMAAFGFIAYRLMVKMDDSKDDDGQTEKITVDKHFSLLFARQATNGKLGEAALVFFAPDEDTVILVPIAKKTVCPTEGKTFETVYDEGGTKALEKAVEETLDIQVDHFLTVNNVNFESICDIFGGMTYVPQEELYMLAHDDDDDISYRKGRAVELGGKQIRQLLQSEKVFSGGDKAIMDFFADALVQMTNNAFKQASLTKNGLDNIYNLSTSIGDNNYDKSEYRLHKTYIEEMLDRRIEPTVLKMPDGKWDEDGRFTIDKTYINELKELITNVGGKITPSLTESSEDGAN